MKPSVAPAVSAIPVPGFILLCGGQLRNDSDVVSRYCSQR
jgi:hypothetical protein